MGQAKNDACTCQNQQDPPGLLATVKPGNRESDKQTKPLERRQQASEQPREPGRPLLFGVFRGPQDSQQSCED